MNYQNNNYSCSCQNNRCRLDGAIGFLFLLLAFAIGLILGAVFYETFLPVLAAIIAFAAAIAAIGIALLIYRYRRCN